MANYESYKKALAAKFMAAMLSNSEVILAIGEMNKKKPFDLYLDALADYAFEAAEAFLNREKKELTNNK